MLCCSSGRITENYSNYIYLFNYEVMSVKRNFLACSLSDYFFEIENLCKTGFHFNIYKRTSQSKSHLLQKTNNFSGKIWTKSTDMHPLAFYTHFVITSMNLLFHNHSLNLNTRIFSKSFLKTFVWSFQPLRKRRGRCNWVWICGLRKGT